MIYLACFSVSVLFAYMAKKSGTRTAFLVFSFLSIAPTIILAGLRDYSIGIDVENYRSFPMYWKGAVASSSLHGYINKYLAGGEHEVLFALFIGSIAQFTGEYRLFLLFTHAFIITCVYIGAFRQRKHVEPDVVMLMFYLLYYSHSLNIMRQYMAMSLIFAALADIEQKKYLRYCIIVGIATMIHTSAVIGLTPMFIYLFLYWKKRKHFGRIKVSLWRKLLFCALLIAAEMGFVPFCKLMIQVGVLDARYIYYLENDDVSAALIVSSLLIAELAGICVLSKSMKRKSSYSHFLIICTITDLLLQQLSTVIAYGKRIAGYFSLINMLTIALMVSSQRRRDNRWFVYAGVAGGALCYWLYIYVYRNASQTFPYQFGILHG